MGKEFLNNLNIHGAGQIQFKTTAGANAGKIDQDGNNLVLTNAVGDILLGDGSSDVFIGDGTNNVDIIFEQSGAIKGDGSAVTLTLGGSNTTLNLENPVINGSVTLPATTVNNKMTFTTSNGYILFDYEPSGDTGEYSTEVPLLKVDKGGTESTILSRMSEFRAVALGIDDTVWLRAGDTSSVIKTNVNLSNEIVLMSAEQGFHAYAFPNNDTTWSNRNEFRFYGGSATASDNGLYIGDGGNTQFIDLSRNLKNIGTITSGKHTINTASDDILTLNQTSTDNKWNYINFNNQGTREWFIGQDSDGNFDLYNDNINAYAITVNLSNNSILLNDTVTVAQALTVTSGDVTLSAGNIIVGSQYGIRFNDANTRIYTNTDTPEDLLVEADQDILLTPDGQVNVHSNLVLSDNSYVVSARKFTARDGNGVMLTADDASSGLSIADNGNATFSGNVVVGNDLYVPNEIYHTGDTDTSIRFSAEDQFRVVTGGSNRFQVQNDKILIGDDVNMQYDSISTSNSGTVVKGGFLNPASESNMVHIPHIVNDLAGFNKWSNATITTSGFYGTRSGSSGSYTYSNEIANDNSGWANAFDSHSSTAGSWYSDNGSDGVYQHGTDTPGVVELQWTNEATYSLWAGIVFGSGSFTATYVKIEAYRGGAWQTLCEITDNTDQVILRQVGSNSGTGAATTRLKYTLGGSVNNSYFRIHSLYMANYRAGDNNLNNTGTDTTRGVNFLERYKDGYLHGHLRPGKDDTYDLGSSSYEWKDGYFDGTVYSDALNVSGNITANQLNLDSIGDYITFYGGGETNHSITSRQLDGGTGDDIRVNTYGSFIVNLDSNNNQNTAANSSFFVGRHGSNASAIGASDLLFQIDGQTGHALPGVDATQNLGNSSFRWGALELKSGGQIQWQNGDARIIEGLVNNYSLSLQTYDGSALSTALRLDGNNTATFSGDITLNPTSTSNNAAPHKLIFKGTDYQGNTDIYGQIGFEDDGNLGQDGSSFYIKGNSDSGSLYNIMTSDGYGQITFGSNVSGVATLTCTGINTGQGTNEVYAMNQAVRTTDDVTFDNLTVTGNLSITGDINSYNVTDLDVTDKTITIGKGQSEANSGGSGIIVDGSAASLLWDESDNRWEFNKNILASNFSGSSSGTNTGDQDISGIATNATAISGKVAKAGDTMTGDLTIDRSGDNISNIHLRRDTNADSTIIGDVNWLSTTAQGTDDRLALIRTSTQGGTSGSRGGLMSLFTRAANSSGFNQTTFNHAGNWSFPGDIAVSGTVDGVDVAGLKSDFDGLGTAASFASSAFATSAQGTKADNALPKAGGTMTGDITLSTDADILKSGTNPFRVFTNGTLGLSISSSQHATFAGAINLDSNHINIDGNGAVIFDNTNNNNAWYIRNGGSNSATLQFGLGDSPGSNIKHTFDGSGNVTFAGDVTVDGGDLTVDNVITKTSGGSFRIKNSGGTTIATFANGGTGHVTGNFGIGGSPSVRLDVNAGTTNTVALFESTDDKAFIKIKDNDTDTHLISKDGHFSIGDSSSDYDNFKINITNGNVTVAGTVDGRDIATDGAKLDGIAAGATANAGTVTSVATGSGLTGGTFSTSGTVSIDYTAGGNSLIGSVNAGSPSSSAQIIYAETGGHSKVSFSDLFSSNMVAGIAMTRDIPMVIHASFDDTSSSTGNLVIPLAGSIAETSVSTGYAPHFFTIPYACVLKKVIMKTVAGSQSSSFTTELKAYKNGAVTGNSSSGELTHSSSTITWTPGAHADITYAAGDKFALVYQKSAIFKYWQDVGVTIVFTLTDYSI